MNRYLVEKAVITAVILSLLLISVGCLHFQVPSLADDSQTMQAITVEVNELNLNYRKVRFWKEQEFNQQYETFSTDKDKYLSDIAKNYRGKWSGYGVKINDWTIFFKSEYHKGGEARYSTTLKCVVHKAISKRDSEYYARFGWLLGPLDLDFIDDNFKESTEGLSLEGTCNTIPTSIMVELPPKDSIYQAWDHPNGHCHAHVWWTKED